MRLRPRHPRSKLLSSLRITMMLRPVRRDLRSLIVRQNLAHPIRLRILLPLLTQLLTTSSLPFSV